MRRVAAAIIFFFGCRRLRYAISPLRFYAMLMLLRHADAAISLFHCPLLPLPLPPLIRHVAAAYAAADAPPLRCHAAISLILRLRWR